MSLRLCTLTPSKRIGRRPASVLSSSAIARRTMRPRRGSRLGVAARDRGEVVVADLDRHRARVEIALGQPARGAARHARRSLRGSRRGPSDRWRTCSRCPTTWARSRRRPGDRRSPARAASATPPASRRIDAGPRDRPARTSTSLSMPCARSLRAVTGPTPHKASTGSPCRKCSTRSGATTVRPSGFCQPDAIFARNLFGATPADAVSPVAARISLLEPLGDVHPRAFRPSCSR